MKHVLDILVKHVHCSILALCVYTYVYAHIFISTLMIKMSENIIIHKEMHVVAIVLLCVSMCATFLNNLKGSSSL